MRIEHGKSVPKPDQAAAELRDLDNVDTRDLCDQIRDLSKQIQTRNNPRTIKVIQSGEGSFTMSISKHFENEPCEWKLDSIIQFVTKGVLCDGDISEISEDKESFIITVHNPRFHESEYSRKLRENEKAIKTATQT